jgi:phage baseplate assembly protein W
MNERGLVVGEGNGIKFSSTENKLILENVRRILLTKRGERVKELEFGSDVREYLFLPEISIDDVLTEAKNSIERCEPRVKVLEATLEYSQDEEFKLKITLQKIADNTTISTEIGL